MDQIVIKKCYLLLVYNWKSHFSWTTQLQTLILHIPLQKSMNEFCVIL